MVSERKSVAVAVLSFTFWGILPVYWRLLDDVTPIEVLAHRVIWSFVFYVAVFLWFLRRHPHPIRRPTARDWLLSTLAAAILTVNWGVYIYAVHTDRVLEASLAYFLNPILNVGVGVLVFREPFPWPLRIATFLGAVGVATQFGGAGEFPWIAIVLASTFSVYGIIKKVLPVEATLGVVLEGAVAAPPALIAAVILRQHNPVPDLNWTHWMLFVGSGAVTGVPLVLFGYVAQRLPYSLLGMLQFLAPTLQFLVGWLIFHEPLTSSRLTAFGLVWLGVSFYLADSLIRFNRARPELET